MKKRITLCGLFLGALLLVQCTENEEKEAPGTAQAVEKDYGGFKNQVKWGEHLVTICVCNDCHTPKKMTNMGPVLDSSRMLSGHPANMPRLNVSQKDAESKGLITAGDLTEWVGPWGVSFTANLTPDDTGLGNWTEAQFMFALREGKYKGLANSRPLLPPMPWEMYKHMTDDEIKAVFAYLKTIPAVKNLVPPPVPPASAGKG